ncbi:MAG: hypothetical protein AAGJ50_09540 [Pseudomonadota bacterium]
MGIPMTGRGMRALKPSSSPTPLLKYLAGAYADEIASIWPAPHHGFLTLPAARRHLVAILIDANLPLTPEAEDRIAERVTFDRDTTVAEPVIGSANSARLMKVLSRAGEVLWTRPDYADLCRLLGREGLAKLLRHRAVFDPAFVRAAALLPDVMLRPKILAALPTLGAAEDMAEAVEIILCYDGPAALAQLAEAIATCGSDVAIMDRIGSALLPNAFAPYAPPPKLPAGFIPIRDRGHLRATALAFKNCLRDYDADLASGRSAIFVADTQPNAVLCLERDARGWMLEEAKLAGNTPLPLPILRSIVKDLRGAGVRVGTGLRDLKNRLHRHACSACSPVVHPPWPDWRVRLAGGPA